jgi:hypothetical protein
MTVKDCTNVKEFWQLKKEIRGSKGHMIVVYDVKLSLLLCRQCGRIQSCRILIYFFLVAWVSQSAISVVS